MDIFKQKRYLGWVILLLVLLNLSTLALLWIGRPLQPHAPGLSSHLQQDPARLNRLLQDELGFDQPQTERYMQLRSQHQKQVGELEVEIRQIKKQMFDVVLQDQPQTMLSDSLLKLAQEKQATIEKLTFQHFLALKKLCRTEQKDQLRLLMDELFRRQASLPANGPPPPLCRD